MQLYNRDCSSRPRRRGACSHRFLPCALLFPLRVVRSCCACYLSRCAHYASPRCACFVLFSADAVPDADPVLPNSASVARAALPVTSCLKAAVSHAVPRWVAHLGLPSARQSSSGPSAASALRPTASAAAAANAAAASAGYGPASRQPTTAAAAAAAASPTKTAVTPSASTVSVSPTRATYGLRLQQRLQEPNLAQPKQHHLRPRARLGMAEGRDTGLPLRGGLLQVLAPKGPRRLPRSQTEP